MKCTKQWRIEIAQQLEVLRLENIALRKQLGETNQICRALEENIRSARASMRLLLEQITPGYLDSINPPKSKRPTRATKASNRR